MDLQTVLTQVESWSVDDRLRLMDQIWDGILEQGCDNGLTDQEKSEIDRRIEEDDAAPSDVVCWDDVKADALKRAGR